MPRSPLAPAALNTLQGLPFCCGKVVGNRAKTGEQIESSPHPSTAKTSVLLSQAEGWKTCPVLHNHSPAPERKQIPNKNLQVICKKQLRIGQWSFSTALAHLYYDHGFLIHHLPNTEAPTR